MPLTAMSLRGLSGKISPCWRNFRIFCAMRASKPIGPHSKFRTKKPQAVTGLPVFADKIKDVAQKNRKCSPKKSRKSRLKSGPCGLVDRLRIFYTQVSCYWQADEPSR